MAKNLEDIIKEKKVAQKISNYLSTNDIMHLNQCSKSVYYNIKNQNIFLHKIIQNSEKP